MTMLNIIPYWYFYFLFWI